MRMTAATQWRRRILRAPSLPDTRKHRTLTNPLQCFAVAQRATITLMVSVRLALSAVRLVHWFKPMVTTRLANRQVPLALTNPFQYTARESDTETGLYYYRARYYDPSVGRFLSEDSIRFDGGANFYGYVGNDPGLLTDPYGAAPCPPQKKCGIKKAPEYGVSGSVPGGTTFAWGAEFLNDATHDPKCCEVRQLISWNNALNGVPHEGFPGGLQAGGWYEDRDQNNKRYGRRTGPYSDPIPGIDEYHGDGYNGKDQPSGFPPGVTLRFRLIVVDKCSGGETIYTSKTINVNF